VLPNSAFTRIADGKVSTTPSIETRPETATDTSPAFPAPNVLLTICPALVKNRLPASTVTFPAFPPAPGKEPEEISVEASRPSIAIRLATLTETSPPLPVPKVLLEIVPPLVSDRLSAEMVT
jgi:hypothetical protein